MKKRIFGIAIMVILTASQLFSQFTDFKLSDYKLPNMKRKSLDINFNMQGTNSSTSSEEHISNTREKRNYTDFDSNISALYKSYLNNESLQREIKFGFGFLWNSYKSTANDENRWKYSSINPSLYIDFINRKYYNNQQFIETSIKFNYDYSKYHNGTETTFDVYQHSLFAMTPIKIGIGRIEQVQDARQAIYLIEELKKQNRLNEFKSNNEVLELAKIISELKNKRFFDSRIRKIQELKSIDEYLENKGCKTISDATYFTSLMDMWEFGDQQIRKSGTRFSLAFYPGINMHDYENSGEGNSNITPDYTLNTIVINSGLEFNYEKPINLYWQNSINIFGYYGLNETTQKKKTSSNKTKIRIPNVNFGLTHTLGYYPNSRTKIELFSKAQYIKIFDKSDIEKEIIGTDGNGFNTSLSLSANYYFSPKFKINAYVTYNYTWMESDENVTLNFHDPSESLTPLNNNIFRSNNTTYFESKKSGYHFNIQLIYSIF